VEHGFVYDRGVFTSLDVPGASATVAFGINARGQIVGAYDDTDTGVFHGFLATPKKK
jgi:probable HAF family extracellular repeat protein